jgi:hypothetical protein
VLNFDEVIIHLQVTTKLAVIVVALRLKMVTVNQAFEKINKPGYHFIIA